MGSSAAWNIIVIACTLVWGSIHPVSKHLMDNGLTPLIMSILRFGIATVATIPIFFRQYSSYARLQIRDVLMLSLLGIMGVALFSICVFYGIDLSNATSSAILINSQPVFAALLAALLLKERLERRQIAGIAVGIAGLLLVITRGDISALSFSTSYLIGNLLCIAAAVLISLYYIGLKRYVSRFGSTNATIVSTAAGSIVLVAIAAAAGEDFSVLTRISLGDWLWILHLSLIGTAFSNLLFHRALTVIGVSKAAGFKFLVPVFGVFFSFFFLGESMSLIVYIGIATIFLALLNINRNLGKHPASSKLRKLL